jgi:hypothetical protein
MKDGVHNAARMKRTAKTTSSSTSVNAQVRERESDFIADQSASIADAGHI